MKVLFVRSGNSGIDPISQNQGESLEKEGIIVSYYDIIGNGVLGYMRNVNRLKKKIKTVNPDIVHAHYSLSGYIASLSSNKTPVITSLMGSDVNDVDAVQNKITNIFIKYFWKATIVKSDEMKKDNNKITVIPNGVDLNNYFQIARELALKKLNWDSKKKHVLFASDPDRSEKNYILARKALDKLPFDEVEVHYLKNIEQSNMKYYYNACDVLLLTSFSEGSPNVIKEAMACNCPIVSTEVGDVRSYLLGVEGCYLTTFDVDHVSKSITKALQFEKRTIGRDKMHDLDSTVIAKRLMKLYNEFI